jgi:glycosyltransferase involved in cell wall biosynthesis
MELMNQYPKILILNITGFSDTFGGGIILKNLFKDWPPEKIALACQSYNTPSPNICFNYYILGNKELQWIFPLNFISHKRDNDYKNRYYITSLSENEINNLEIKDSSSKSKDKKKGIRQNFYQTIDKMGFEEILQPFKISDDFLKWINYFSPDIIYTQISSLKFLNIVKETRKITNAKLVIHIMDDWPTTIYRNKIFPLQRFIILYKFKKILKKADLCMAISDGMAAEYQRRYGVPFQVFFNPPPAPDIQKQNDLTKKSEFIIVYTGRIGTSASNSIIDLAVAVHQLFNKGIPIKLKIYTDIDRISKSFSDSVELAGVELLAAISSSELWNKLLKADLLYYGVDFDDASIDYIKLSMPTKIPAYMFTKIPILCYGPNKTYAVKFLKENKFAYCVDDEGIENLEKVIVEIMNNEDERLRISGKAYLYAIKEFNEEKIRGDFHKILCSLK